MGVMKRLLGNALPDVVDDYTHSPYDGEQFPKGSLGAVGCPGELEVTFPPGKVKALYRVYGEPRFWDRQKNKHWSLPAVELSIMPVDPSTTPRLQMVEEAGKTDHVKAIGWSRKQMAVFEVPEPGGAYLAKIGGAAPDDQAHVLFEED